MIPEACKTLSISSGALESSAGLALQATASVPRSSLVIDKQCIQYIIYSSRQWKSLMSFLLILFVATVRGTHLGSFLERLRAWTLSSEERLRRAESKVLEGSSVCGWM